MTEQNQAPKVAADDTEGHVRFRSDDDAGEDTEGHVRFRSDDDAGDDADDTEGHFRRT